MPLKQSSIFKTWLFIMKFKDQALKSFRLHNFKAVRNSGVVKFTPLTVFIGNNGSGKSSLIEGLETFQTIVTEGLDEAMNRWRGFEFIWNSFDAGNKLALEDLGIRRHLPQDEIYRHNSIEFDLKTREFEAFTRVAALPGANEVHIARERYFAKRGRVRWSVGNEPERFDSEIKRSSDGQSVQNKPKEDNRFARQFRPDESIFSYYGEEFIASWQFLNLQPEAMAEPRPTKRSGGQLKLSKDGSNIADYLNDILEQDPSVLSGIIDTLRYVLPYAKDVQTSLTSELGRQRYIRLSEGQTKIPGWLLSTGTLRVLALLAVLRHPTPPPLVCIEEIENGLDPRTLNLIVEEIRFAVESGRTQVIVTTHSPYLLDLLLLSQIIVVERDESGQPVFFRPDEEGLRDWSKSFAPGQLYTMSQLQRPVEGRHA
jgi:predicted ATPase